MIKWLLETGTTYILDRWYWGVQPLIQTINENKLDIVEHFLKKGVGNDSLDAIQCLLKHGTNVDGSENNKTPLTWSAEKGNLDLFELLLNNGTNINKLGNDGNTPLATAVRYKQSEAAKYLTKNHANICKVGESGKTPLLWAVLNEDLDMITWLLDSGAEYIVDTVLLDAIGTKNLNVVQLLKERRGLELENDKLHLSWSLSTPKTSKLPSTWSTMAQTWLTILNN